MAEVTRNSPFRGKLTDLTPEAAEIREALALQLDGLAAHMRAARVRSITLGYENEPLEGPPVGGFHTYSASPYSKVTVEMEIELP